MKTPYAAAVFACLSLTSGCSAGSGWYPGRLETFAGPGVNPPLEQTETLARITDRRQPSLPPVFSEAGNLWPGAPPAVLTLVDLRREQAASGQQDIVRAPPHRGGYGMCASKTAPGVGLGIC